MHKFNKFIEGSGLMEISLSNENLLGQVLEMILLNHLLTDSWCPGSRMDCLIILEFQDELVSSQITFHCYLKHDLLFGVSSLPFDS